jgi:hypothetical protein
MPVRKCFSDNILLVSLPSCAGPGTNYMNVPQPAYVGPLREGKSDTRMTMTCTLLDHDLLICIRSFAYLTRQIPMTRTSNHYRRRSHNGSRRIIHSTSLLCHNRTCRRFTCRLRTYIQVNNIRAFKRGTCLSNQKDKGSSQTVRASQRLANFFAGCIDVHCAL